MESRRLLPSPIQSEFSLMIFVIFCGTVVYLCVGYLLTLLFIKWANLPKDMTAVLFCCFWPLLAPISTYLELEWRKRKRKKFRVAILEENESDEAFAKRVKGL